MSDHGNIARFVGQMKRIFKNTVFLSRRGLEYWANAQNQRSALILQYHSIRPTGKIGYADYVHPSLSVSVDVFDKQLAFIDRHFEVVTLEKLLAYVNGDCRISRQPLSITFDDGYKDNYLYAFPQLLKYGFPAMFYLTTDCIDAKRPLWTSELRHIIFQSPKSSLYVNSLKAGFSMESEKERLTTIQELKAKIVVMEKWQREEILEELRREAGISTADKLSLDDIMLNWSDVKLMRNYRMQFGAHTLSHPSLPNIPEHEARNEILSSKRVLEERLCEEIRHFSYPNPGDKQHSSERIAAILKEAGFSSAVTSIPGRVVEGDEVFQLKRKGIYALYQKLPDFYFWLQKEVLAEMRQRFRGPAGFGIEKRPVFENIMRKEQHGTGLGCTID